VVVLWLALAIGLTIGETGQVGGLILIWLVFPILVVGVWRWAFVPFLTLTPDAVFIQNRLTSRSVPYSEISDVRGGYYGLRLRTKSGEVVTAWAVQKSNAASRLHKRTRADEVASAIMERIG
jgi:hypothetical protein